MAPRATAAIILAATLVAATVDGDRARPQPQNTHRQRQQPVATRLLAWGQRRSRGREATDKGSNRNQVQARRPTWEEEARAAAAPAEADGSWTHSAFRAFHELRAGPPSSAAGEEAEKDDGGWTTAGPFEGVRRLASRLLSRSMGEALGRKVDDDYRENQMVQAENGTSTHDSRPPPACWHMKGRLTNAETGQTVALVEGVELSRSLAFEIAPAGRRARGKQSKEGGSSDGSSAGKSGDGLASVRSGGGEVAPAAAGAAGAVGEELEVDKALKPGMWTAFGALASSKFFMYQDPDTGEPMEYFRNTPVEKKQTVRTYERFSQIVSHLLQPNGRVLVVSEWGGRSVKAETANNNGVEEVEGGKGGLVGRGGGEGGGGGSPRRVFNLHFFVQARTPKEEREVKKWEDRPMARWIAFGPTPPRAHGCKEIYSYVTGARSQESEPKPRGRGAKKTAAAVAAGGGGGGGGKTAGASGGGLMSYTRYGECPTWYGTGRMCGLDVQAKRVGSFESLPAKLRQRVLEVDPEFEEGPPCSMEDCRTAAARDREERKEERRLRRKRSLRRPFGAWGSGAGGGAS